MKIEDYLKIERKMKRIKEILNYSTPFGRNEKLYQVECLIRDNIKVIDNLINNVVKNSNSNVEMIDKIKVLSDEIIEKMKNREILLKK